MRTRRRQQRPVRHVGSVISVASTPEHIIHGSPLWLMAGIRLFGSMMVWSRLGCLVDAGGHRPSLYGVFEIHENRRCLRDQEQRHVEVHEGPDTARNAG